MSLLDDLKSTISDAASTARDVSLTLGAQAQAQVAIKRLQIDHAKKLHELGTRTHEWHRAGNLIAAGPVPREVQDLCRQLDDITNQLEENTKKLEEAKRQAELRAETRNLNRNSTEVEAIGSTPVDGEQRVTAPTPNNAITPIGTAPSVTVEEMMDIPSAPTYVIDSPASADAETIEQFTTNINDLANQPPRDLSDPRPGNPTRPLPPSE